MATYDIYFINNQYEIWKWENNGVTATCSRFKTFKTKKGAENWAKKQWACVNWR